MPHGLFPSQISLVFLLLHEFHSKMNPGCCKQCQMHPVWRKNERMISMAYINEEDV